MQMVDLHFSVDNPVKTEEPEKCYELKSRIRWQNMESGCKNNKIIEKMSTARTGEKNN